MWLDRSWSCIQRNVHPNTHGFFGIQQESLHAMPFVLVPCQNRFHKRSGNYHVTERSATRPARVSVSAGRSTTLA